MTFPTSFIYTTMPLFTPPPFTANIRILTKCALTWYNERIGNGFPVYIADLDGEVVGFSTFGHFRVWPCYRYTVENSVYVHIDHRGKGISKLLLQPLIDRAREMKLSTLDGLQELMLKMR